MALTKITRGVIKPNENYDTRNINSTGVITATSFHGDGTNLTGIDASSITHNGNVKVQAHILVLMLLVILMYQELLPVMVLT